LPKVQETANITETELNGKKEIRVVSLERQKELRDYDRMMKAVKGGI